MLSWACALQKETVFALAAVLSFYGLYDSLFFILETTSSAQKSELRKRQASFSLDLKDIRSFKLVECGTPPESCIRFHAKDGTSYTPLRIRGGKSGDFVTALQKYVTL